MNKITMQNPVVEMDGDEMTRILWQMVKDELLSPFVELNTLYYDLGLPHRDETDDQITIDAAEAIKVHRVGVKCATITPNLQRVEEYGLKKMWKSPNATIRAILDGTVFRTPIMLANVKPVVNTWKQPIVIARHAYGDVYKATEHRVEGAGKAELVFTGTDGKTIAKEIFTYDGPGVLQGMHNKDDSIESFARACFTYALDTKQDIWFATKDTISKEYDQTFKLIFQRIFEEEYQQQMDAAGLTYFYTLIDDAVARVIRSEGGFIWACKNYDGDVMSDLVATAFGSLPMMTSVLVSPDGNFEYEAAHGTVTAHYRRYQQGERNISSNPLALIFAWVGALKKRGELDGNQALCDFADKLGKASIDTFEAGYLTKDLASLCEPGGLVEVVNSEQLLKAIRQRLEA